MQCRVHSLSVVEEMNPSIDCISGLAKIVKELGMMQLVLHAIPEQLHWGIVAAIANTAHGLFDVPLGKICSECVCVVRTTTFNKTADISLLTVPPTNEKRCAATGQYISSPQP